ncbi:Hypothetical protein SM2011_a0286 (plasmid) [Sinorhizobium meliloti 2011]|nr:Hypothetical protein SM2011_a0286 [Sinorhizobium meliloti 2011]
MSLDLPAMSLFCGSGGRRRAVIHLFSRDLAQGKVPAGHTSCQTPSFRSTMAATSWRGPVHSSPSILRARAASRPRSDCLPSAPQGPTGNSAHTPLGGPVARGLDGSHEFLAIDLVPVMRDASERLDLAAAREIVTASPDVLGGTPVIRGTPVPVYDVAAS